MGLRLESVKIEVVSWTRLFFNFWHIWWFFKVSLSSKIIILYVNFLQKIKKSLCLTWKVHSCIFGIGKWEIFSWTYIFFLNSCPHFSQMCVKTQNQTSKLLELCKWYVTVIVGAKCLAFWLPRRLFLKHFIGLEFTFYLLNIYFIFILPQPKPIC